MIIDPLQAAVLQKTQGEFKTSGEVAARLQSLRDASVDFEAMLIQQMFQSMEKTLENGGLVSGGPGVSGSVYSSMMTQSISQSMANNQSLGLSEQLYQSVIKKDPDLQKYIKDHPEKATLHPLPGRPHVEGLPAVAQPAESMDGRWMQVPEESLAKTKLHPLQEKSISADKISKDPSL
jgi:Rod binding domain-containing protein